jgi:hypothetical protein
MDPSVQETSHRASTGLAGGERMGILHWIVRQHDVGAGNQGFSPSNPSRES